MTDAISDRGDDPVVVALGEPLIRLSVRAGERWASSATADLHVGGAEVNVVAALSCLGLATRLVSAVPDSPLGDRVVVALRSAGVDTRFVRRIPDSRMGLYFVEQATHPRGHRVTYDRAGSAFLQLEELPEAVVARAQFAHLSGITPALGGSVPGLVDSFVAMAGRGAARLSIDVNYRSLLWPPDRAAEALAPLLGAADVVICAERDVRTLFGLTGDAESLTGDFARALAPHAAVVAVPCTDPGVVVHTSDGTVRLAGLVAEEVDRFGAGDAFTAGLLFGLSEGESPVQAATVGLTLSAMARTVRGDMTLFSRAELDAALTLPAGGLVR